jgi:hypothetical protein
MQAMPAAQLVSLMGMLATPPEVQRTVSPDESASASGGGVTASASASLPSLPASSGGVTTSRGTEVSRAEASTARSPTGMPVAAPQAHRMLNAKEATVRMAGTIAPLGS